MFALFEASANARMLKPRRFRVRLPSRVEC